MLTLHYVDRYLSCAADHLVPILTLKRDEAVDNPAIWYKLTRVY